ncbi:MAG: GGDEF domain-containing protein, partial [Lachnospiraceae bacterium]|nr:GGDEF domain-containing protein [Lachnospiraceae bacterium]
MSYSIISLLALILNLIINRGAFKTVTKHSKDIKEEQLASVRYSHFLVVANLYFVADLGWGLLYERHDIDWLFPFLYSDCVFYFLFMFMTMLAWMRYIVAYLDKKGRRSKALLYAVWSLFTIALINLIVNRFYPFIFSFNDKHEYVTESGRHADCRTVHGRLR